MQKGLIITCPKHDDATAYLSYYSKDIINEATNKDLKKKKITDKELNLVVFSEILTKLDYKLIVFNGHGSPNSIFGYKQNVILKLNKNSNLLKERIIYARSCNAGEELGPGCVKQDKAECFIGYILPFAFYMDPRWTANPHNDKIAKLFIEPSNFVPISIIKGNSTMDSHINSKNQMLKAMNKLMSRKPEEETPFYLEALWNNYSGQVIFGKEEARL